MNGRFKVQQDLLDSAYLVVHKGFLQSCDYGKRWSIERLFSLLKERFGLSKNRFIGID